MAAVPIQLPTDAPAFRHIADGTLRTAVYHGQRSQIASTLPEFDVVLTTYDTVRAEVSKGHSALQSFIWYRIVLDEGTPTIPS
jgi:SWI/SNF-related matrix-associated actin-dependent regulator of chromatin subfamily A3